MPAPVRIAALSASPSLDITYVVDELTLGAIHRPTSVIRVAGGKALNAARAATTLGADVTVVAMLGGDIGSVVERGAVASGVHISRVDIAAETRSCVSVLSVASGGLTEIYEHPTAVSATEWAAALARTDVVLASGVRWLLVSGGMPAQLGDEALGEVLALAARRGVSVALDSHGPALRAALSAGSPALLKVNRAEAAEVLGRSVDSPLVDLAFELRERTNGLVVVTDGVGGAIGVSADSACHVSLTGHTGAFPVGSGDSFLGALVVALDRNPDGGESLEAAMRLGTAAATANAMLPGAALFERAAAEALLPDVRVIPVAFRSRG